MRRRRGRAVPIAIVLVTLFLGGGLFMTPAPAGAYGDCWRCFYYFIKGSEYFDDFSFDICSPYEGGGGPWDCYEIDEDCYEYGQCGQYVYV